MGGGPREDMGHLGHCSVCRTDCGGRPGVRRGPWQRRARVQWPGGKGEKVQDLGHGHVLNPQENQESIGW